jgi:hypothetical protein
MPKFKPYLVRIVMDIAVVAPDERAAKLTGLKHLKDEVITNSTLYGGKTVDVMALTTYEDIPRDWRGSIPWGASDERTLSEWVNGVEP